MTEFQGFPKIARLRREIVITEKLDGTNAGILIDAKAGEPRIMGIASRTRWITPEDDNHGFAKWVKRNEEELLKLGDGLHYGEWWGNGIQRGYGLKEKRFSLFNTHRWSDDAIRPKCCHVVPILHKGMFDSTWINGCINTLRALGSTAAPGYMNPEGIIIYHTHGNLYFKQTIEKDEEPKSHANNNKPI